MKPLRVAVLGVLAVHKGLLLVEELVEAARRRGIAVDVVLIGYVPGAPNEERSIRISGAYDDAELDVLIAREDPDVIWFPVRLPETYSFTLTAALRSGRPVAVPDIGALRERVAGLQGTIVYPWRDDAAEIVQTLRRAATLPHSARGHDAPSGFYDADYLRPPAGRAYHPSTPPIVTYETRLPSGQLDACAYIRVHLPLRHPAIASGPVVSLREGELPVEACGVLVQRTAIGDVEFATRLIAWCRTHDVPLVYETDDNLFDIAADHADFAYYRMRNVAALSIAESANAILTSTQGLADALRARNPRVFVIENALDERLWYEQPVAPSATASGEIRILYMGTATHGDDLAVLRDAITSLRMRDGRRAVLEIIGAQERSDSWCTTIPVPLGAATSYPSFVRWLRSLGNRWSFGVIPLRANTFNAGKSAIKALDYGAIGVPSIASDVAPYRLLAEAGAPLLALARESTDAWVAALETALTHSGSIAASGRAMRAWVRANATLKATAAARREVLAEAFSLPVAAPSSG